MELINRQYIKRKRQSQQEGAVWKNQIRAKNQLNISKESKFKRMLAFLM